MINTINGSGFNQSFTITKIGAVTLRQDNNSLENNIDLNAQQTQFINYNQMITNGTGDLVDLNGVVLYCSQSAGRGSLSTAIIANRGPNTVYYGINTDSENMVVASGTPLYSGESIQLNDHIYRVWAITNNFDEAIVNFNGIINQSNVLI